MKRFLRLAAAALSLLLLLGSIPALSLTALAADSPYMSRTPEEYFSKRTIIGWEGDLHATYTYIDGSFHIYGRDHERAINLGISSYGVPAKWYMAEHFLPCLVSEYTQQDFVIKVENFSDKLVIDGNDFVAVYTRMTVTNNGESRVIPQPDSLLIPLDETTSAMSQPGAVIGAGETVVREYAVISDWFGGDYTIPENEKVAALGGFDAHYAHMKEFWTNRLSGIVQINEVPAGYEDILYTYRATYIYALITKDGDKMNVNEDVYNNLYNHDFINIFLNILQMGDYEQYGDIVKWVFDTMTDYEDGFYKVSFPFAYYIMKTGDVSFARQYFDKLQARAHYIDSQRSEDTGLLNPDGTPARIMKAGTTLDCKDISLTDCQAALAGLKAYKYVCDALYEETPEEVYKTESEFAAALYANLFASTETVLADTMKKYSFEYLPMDMQLPNELNVRSSFTDPNMLLSLSWGFWSWDGYLFGADETDCLMYTQIDETYTYMQAWREALGMSDTIYCMGAYGGPVYCAVYNAGLGIAGLRSELYRDWGIEAALWMIDNAQVAPYAWSENLTYPSEEFPSNIAWDGPTAYVSGGGGNGGWGPHIWGMSQMSQMIVASFIAERADGVVEIGSGLPYSFVSDGEQIAVSNYPYSAGNRMGFSIKTTGDKSVTLTVDASSPVEILFRLPAFVRNIASATDADGKALSFDSEAGSVTVPAGTASVTVTLTDAAAAVQEERDVTRTIERKLVVTEDVTADMYTATSYRELTDARTDAEALAASHTATAAALTAALTRLESAYSGLTLLTDGTVIANDQDFDEFLANYDSKTEVWQTFTTGEKAGRVDAVDIWVERLDGMLDEPMDFEGLRLSVYALNGNKYMPYRLGEVIETASLGREDGSPVRWHFTFDNVVLEPNTRYAILLSVNADDPETVCGFRWMLTEPIPGEYLMSVNENNTKTDHSYKGSGSFRIYFGSKDAKTALHQAASEALVIDLSGYTDASAAAVKQAISAVDALLRGESYTADEESAALAALQSAVTALETKPATPVTTEPSTAPATTPATEQQGGIPSWIWIVVGCAAVAVVAVILIVRTSRKKK